MLAGLGGKENREGLRSYMLMVRWFALVPIEVGVDPLKSNSKGYVKPIYNDEGKRRSRGSQI